MQAESVALLCCPLTHEPLRLVSMPGADGVLQQELVGVSSGARFPIRDGIPLLIDQASIAGFNQRYQRLYDRVAGFYDRSIGLFALLAGGGEAHFRWEYLRELPLHDGDRLLEVSIGTGANLRYLPPSVSFVGLDLSWGMLKRCQKNLPRWQREAELIMGNAEALPLRQDAFDAVLHVGGINAFDDQALAIAEMVRVAKPGSMIMIVDETAKLMQRLAWMPSVRTWLQEHGERFAAPVALVPAGMRDVQVREIAKGNMYCLTFFKP